MARPRPEKSTTSKPKPVLRKKEKPDLCAWFTEESPDDTDIGPWMVRRVDGETRKGKPKPTKDNSDPRTAPPFNKFLWASKSLCKAIENVSDFAHESLHEHLMGRVQVRLKQIPADPPNKPDDKSIDKPVHVPTGLSKSASNVVGVDTNGNSAGVENGATSHRCQSATVNVSGCTNGENAREDAAQDNRETEVTRLKRLIAIARRYRQATSEGCFHSQSCDVDNPYTSYISISSEVSDATGDSGVSLSSLKSHLAEVDGVWALQYLNGDSENCYAVSTGEGESVLGDDHSLNQPIRFAYTQGNNGRGSLFPTSDRVMIECDQSCSKDPSSVKESTPFITALTNYKANNGDLNGITPLVRSLKSGKSKDCGVNGVHGNEITKTMSPNDSLNANIMNSDLDHSNINSGKGKTPKGETTSRPSSGASVKIQKFKIIFPSTDTDILQCENNVERNLSPSHPAHVMLQKLREKGINVTASVKDENSKPEPTSRASSAVFPIGQILPVVDAIQHRGSGPMKRTGQDHRLGFSNSMSDSCLSDSANITANDLLLHRGEALYDVDKYYVVQRGDRVLGPPPFRPMTNRTPLHRARDTSRKRMHGHTFAQETQDLYQKLILAKNGVTDHRYDLLSGRRRPGAMDFSVSRSAGNSRRWTGRPLGHAVTDTEFHEARASLSARFHSVDQRPSATDL